MISIIIPTYNRKKSLQKTLKVLQNQSYKDFEIIVVDDGSSDSTENFIKTNYPQIKFLKQNNQGPGTARNTGIKKAQGEIIAFTDDDCVPNKNWLKNALPYFKDPKIIAVEGATLKNDFITPTSIPIINYFGQKYSTCNMFYRKKTLEELNGFDERFKFAGEDTNLARRALKKGKIKFVPSVKVIHPVKHYSTRGFIKKHLSFKKTYWQVLGAKESKKFFSWETLIFYPFYASVIFLALKLNLYTAILLGYVYLTTFLIHNLYLTKGRVMDIFRHKKTLTKLVFLWWIIIVHDTFYRLWGIIRFRRFIL